MSIYGPNKRVKIIIDGKVYESTLGSMDTQYVPKYNGEDMKKVKPIEKETQKEEEMSR